MKIGIYGGTFNPIHNGHVHILKAFAAGLHLDKILLIPTCVPPHKEAHGLAEVWDRVAMCQKAAAEIAEIPVEVSELEIHRQGKSYTADTVTQLREMYPDAQLFLLMGEDMFLTLHHWARPETIFRGATVCASPRSVQGLSRLLHQKKFLEKTYGARCIVEEIPYMPVSSTEIRTLAEQGKSFGEFVPPSVEAYIEEHALYGGPAYDNP